MTWKVYASFLIVFSAITFLLYAVDKKRAIEGRWRISESMLLGFSFFGGGIGGYLAMQLTRHKTKKVKFHLVNLLGIAWQVALLVYLIKNPNGIGA